MYIFCHASLLIAISSHLHTHLHTHAHTHTHAHAHTAYLVTVGRQLSYGVDDDGVSACVGVYQAVGVALSENVDNTGLIEVDQVG